MKKIMTILFVAAALLSLAQETPRFTLKGELQNKNGIYRSGEPIVFEITVSSPENYRFAGWNVFAYLPNIPENFCKTLKLTPSIHKNPKWSSVGIQPYQWVKGEQKTVKCSFSTKNWPTGDYAVSIAALFRDKIKPDTKTDKYLNCPLVFTIE